MLAWIVWLIVAAVLGVAELVTMTFALGLIAVGACVAAGVAALREGDVLLIAGKGHETGQIVGDRILPFSDQESVRSALGVSAA